MCWGAVSTYYLQPSRDTTPLNLKRHAMDPRLGESLSEQGLGTIGVKDWVGRFGLRVRGLKFIGSACRGVYIRLGFRVV